jgi:hypothetical protein
MEQYKVRFMKRLCNDIGVQHNCLQASIDIHRAKSAERALRAAQQRFQRSRRTADWRIYADVCEITPPIEGA